MHRTESWLLTLGPLALSLAAFAATAQETPQNADRGATVRRIVEPEQRVDALEPPAVMSEPETRVRGIEVWVDENGVEYDEPQPGTRSVVTYQPGRACRRQKVN